MMLSCNNVLRKILHHTPPAPVKKAFEKKEKSEVCFHLLSPSLDEHK